MMFSDNGQPQLPRRSTNNLVGKFIDMSQPMAYRVNEKGGSSIQGKCERNPLTGKAVLKEASVMNDYCIMDLWERSALYGSPEDLIHDPYVFKIVPLAMRTWIYHYLFSRSELIAKSEGANGILKAVLDFKVIDADKVAGRWSPLLCLGPTALIAVFTADFVTAMACIAITVLNLSISVLCNTPQWFGHHRLISFAPRLIFFCLIIVRMFMQIEEGGPIVMLSFVVILALLVIDFIFGDGVAFVSVGLRCNYEVLRILPNRVFICRRHGAAFLEDPDHGLEVSQVVSGTSYFDEMVILVESRGLLFQLKPMAKADWTAALEYRANTNRPVAFYGLDIFNKKLRTTVEIDKVAKGAAEELAAMNAANVKPAKAEGDGVDLE